MALYGIDESNYQSTQFGQDFTIIKATEGTSYVDPTCDNKYQANKSAGKLLGFYHYARFTDAVAEANFFHSNTTGYEGEAIPVIDIETNTNVSWVYSFVHAYYELTKVWPLVYMSASTAKNADWSSVSATCGLWAAGYPAKFNVINPPTPAGDGSDFPYAIGSWTTPTIWQYSSSAGTLDRDVAYLSVDAWHRIATGDRNVTTTTTVAPTPTTTTTTQPAPEPTTTTTTEGITATTVLPEPTTTTTVVPTVTTTSTNAGDTEPPASFWNGVWSVIVAFIQYLRGVK